MGIQTERATAVAELIDFSKARLGAALNRSTLNDVLQRLIQLAARREFWSAEEFADPSDGELQSRYLIHEESDSTYALYLNVMRPGKVIVPHDHTTWACIAAVEGTEINTVYERADDGKTAGHAVLKTVATKDVGPGAGIALLPDDIHSVKILDESGIRHLHFYGLALEKLNRRTAFNLKDNTCKTMDIGVQTKRSGN